MVVHEMRTSRRPWVQADSRSPHALEPNTASNCFRSHRKSRVPGGRRSFRQLDLGCPNTRNFGPSNDTPIPDQSIRGVGLLYPFFRLDLLEVVPTLNPERLQVANPYGHRFLTEKKLRALL